MNTFLNRALIVGLIAMFGLAANARGATMDVDQAGSATAITQETAGSMAEIPADRPSHAALP